MPISATEGGDALPETIREVPTEIRNGPVGEDVTTATAVGTTTYRRSAAEAGA